MSARLAANRRRLLNLADRRARAGSTSTAPMPLYSASMSQLEADQPGHLGLRRLASAALCARLCRSSTLHRTPPAGGDGLKLHSLSAAVSFNRVYPPSGTT